MTSRSIQTEARAYQNEHGVPYAEALRHVREARGDQSSEGSRLVVNLGTGVFPATGLTSETATPVRWTPGASALPGDGAGSLSVYGRQGDPTKSLYLSSLVRKHFTERPVVIFTEHPELYPVRANIDFIGPSVVQAILQGADMPEDAFPDPEGDDLDEFSDGEPNEACSPGEALHEQFGSANPDGRRVFIYDLTPCRSASDEALEALFDVPHAALLYASAEIDAEGNPIPWTSRFSAPGQDRTHNEVTVCLVSAEGRGRNIEGWVAHRDHSVRLDFRG